MEIDDITDVELEKHLMVAKTALGTLIDKSALIDFIRHAVDKADCISFASERSRKFISKSRPSFSVRFNPEKAKQVHPGFDNSDYEAYTRYRSNILHKELISPINQLLSSVMCTVFDGDVEFKNVDPEYLEFTKRLIGDRDIKLMLQRCNQVFKNSDVDIEEVRMIAGTIVGMQFVPETEEDNEIAVVEIML
ncbi:hypothetical protein [Proteus mirabilis]|uniref:hypothetical protein n=1 Tax=Proteus mirabilis TaxID=584 RepID=UPI0034D756F4